MKKNAEAIENLSVKTGKMDDKLDDIMRILQTEAEQRKAVQQTKSPPPSQQLQTGADAAQPSHHIARTGADGPGAASAIPSGNRTPPAASYSASSPRHSGGRVQRYHHPHHPSRAPQARPPPMQAMGGAVEEDVALRLARALQQQLIPEDKGLSHPSNFVFKGHKRVRAGVGELEVEDYTWGFIQMYRKEKDEETREAMLDHIEAVLDDARQKDFYDWRNVRFWSEMVCSKVSDPEDRMTWDSTYDIDKLQNTYAHRPRDSEPGSSRRDKKNKTNASGSTRGQSDNYLPGPPCQPFQAGKCPEPSHHVVDGYRHMHICETCLRFMQKTAYHPGHRCNNRARAPPPRTRGLDTK